MVNINNKLICGLENGSIQIWDLIEFKVLKLIDQAHKEAIICIQVWNNSRIFTSSNDFKLKLFDLNTYECLRTFHGHYDPVYHISIQNNKLISFSTMQVKEWNLIDGNCLSIKSRHSSGPCHLYLRNDLYIDTYRKSIQINKNETVKILNGHNYSVSCLIELENNKIASCSYDGIINIWNIETEENVLKINANLRDEATIAKCVIYALTTETILSCYYGLLNIWNINTGDCLKTLEKIQDIYIMN